MTEQERLQAELELLELEEAEEQERLAQQAAAEAQQQPEPVMLSEQSETGLGDKLQTGLEAFANAASLGYLPQLQAMAEPGITNFLNQVTGRWSEDERVQPTPYVEARDQNIARQAAQAERNPLSSVGGQLAGIGTSIATMPGAAPKTALQAARNAAIIGGLYNPGDETGELSPVQPTERATNAAIGGALGGALTGAAKGLQTLGGKIMNRAVGAKDAPAQVGQRLMDEGIYGTKSAMAQQVSRKIKERGDDLTKAVSIIGDDISVAPIASRLQQESAKLTQGGQVAPNLSSAASQYDELSSFLSGLGKMKPAELLNFKQTQGDLGYKLSGAPGTSYAADAARKASKEAGEILKAAYSSKFPQSTNEVAKANEALSALFKANKGLDRGDSISDAATSLLLSGGGFATGGAPGIVGGRLLNTNIGKATAAYGARGAGKAVEKAAPFTLGVTRETRKK